MTDDMRSLCKNSPLRARVFKRDNHRCLCCGSEDEITIDHIVPISKGGTNAIKNLQTLCRICNVKKGNKAIDYLNYDEPRTIPENEYTLYTPISVKKWKGDMRPIELKIVGKIDLPERKKRKKAAN